MVTDLSEPRFTTEQLIAGAAQYGLHATPRLITDWASLGLIAHPWKPGAGKGNGWKKGTWSAAQASLFLDLLTLRQDPEHPLRSVAALANGPVLSWLLTENRSDVPLEQVRLALATWCGRHRSRQHTPGARVKKLAREITSQIESPQASESQCRELRKIIERNIRYQQFDVAQLHAAVEAAFNPRRVVDSVGPKDAPMTVASIMRGLEAQATAFLSLETFSDEEYEDARIVYRRGLFRYDEMQPLLDSDPQRGSMRFEPRTFDRDFLSACKDMVLLLGMGRLSPGRRAEVAKRGDGS
jgi:hypothetical protein